MSFGRFIIVSPLVLGAVFGLIACVLSLTNNEAGVAIFTALSVTLILMGLIFAITLPQYARMIDESSKNQ